MKKFKYRLEALLKVKKHLEKEKQKELAAVRQQAVNQQKELQRIDHDRKRVLKNKQEKQTNKLSVAELLVYSRFLLKLKGKSLSGQEFLRGLRKTEEEKRQSLLQAVKERKTYDKLKERQHEQFNKDVISLEAKESDEIGLNSFRQKDKSKKTAHT